MVQRHIDSLITFRIIALLATPWEKTKAFELGIVDKNGTPLKRTAQLKTPEEKNAYSILIRLVFKIKRLFNKVPTSAKLIASYAIALNLIKETYQLSDNDVNVIKEEIDKMEQKHLNEQEKPDIIDEEIANVAGGENIAGFKEPPGPQRRFRGQAVFDVPSNVFNRDTFEKKKRKHFKKYLGLHKEDLNGMGEAIRQFAKTNPKEAIIIRDEITGAMRYIRRDMK